MAFPSILLALAIMSVLGPGLVQTIIAVAITGVPQTNRIIRSSVLSIKRFDYIEAARAMGALNAHHAPPRAAQYDGSAHRHHNAGAGTSHPG